MDPGIKEGEDAGRDAEQAVEQQPAAALDVAAEDRGAQHEGAVHQEARANPENQHGERDAGPEDGGQTEEQDQQAAEGDHPPVAGEHQHVGLLWKCSPSFTSSSIMTGSAAPTTPRLPRPAGTVESRATDEGHG